MGASLRTFPLLAFTLLSLCHSLAFAQPSADPAAPDPKPGEEAIAKRILGVLPNYRRILDIGRAAGPADAVIVGDEKEVERQITAVFDAGATDLWAAPFIVGDRQASRARTRALLAALAGS